MRHTITNLTQLVANPPKTKGEFRAAVQSIRDCHVGFSFSIPKEAIDALKRITASKFVAECAEPAFRLQCTEAVANCYNFTKSNAPWCISRAVIQQLEAEAKDMLISLDRFKTILSEEASAVISALSAEQDASKPAVASVARQFAAYLPSGIFKSITHAKAKTAPATAYRKVASGFNLDSKGTVSVMADAIEYSSSEGTVSIKRSACTMARTGSVWCIAEGRKKLYLETEAFN